MKAEAKTYRPVQESLVLKAYANSESRKLEGMKMKTQAKLFIPVHVIYVFIAYASSQ